MLWVGTNNHGHTPEQICGGIMAIVQVIKNKLPHARTVVLVGFFPDAFPNKVLIYLLFVSVESDKLSSYNH